MNHEQDIESECQARIPGHYPKIAFTVPDQHADCQTTDDAQQRPRPNTIRLVGLGLFRVVLAVIEEGDRQTQRTDLRGQHQDRGDQRVLAYQGRTKPTRQEDGLRHADDKTD